MHYGGGALTTRTPSARLAMRASDLGFDATFRRIRKSGGHDHRHGQTSERIRRLRAVKIQPQMRPL